MSATLFTGHLEIQGSGPWFVGGHTPPPAGADAATAQRDKQPILPTSALKGALREAAYRRLRSEGQPVCEPWTPWERRLAQCAENPCFVCRVFGAPGPDRPGVVEDGDGEPGAGWMANGLRLSDGLPTEPAPLSRRFGVGIDRVTRRAAEAHLFQREIADPGQSTTLLAPFRARLSPEDMAYLEECARLVNSLGNSRTRGLGAVAMRFVQEAPPPQASVLTTARKGERARVRVTALEPLHLGAPPRPDSTRATLTRVPGSALHGALFAAAHRVNPREAKHLATTLNLSDLLPAIDDALPVPYHRALLRCRSCEAFLDRTLDDAVARELLQRPARDLSFRPASACPRCGGEDLKPAEGALHGADLRRRLVTRLAIDPHTQSAAPKMLYSREQIEPGSRFLGTVDALDARCWAALDTLASQGEPVLLGGLRTRGLGAVRVELLPPPADDLSARLAGFSQRARQHPGVKAAGWDPNRLLLVQARTPLASPPGLSGGDCVGQALFGEGAYRVLGSWQRLETRSGWNDQQGRVRPLREVYRGGSCWLLELSAAPSLPALQDAEHQGIGADDDKKLGLNRLYLCPQTPEPRSTR